MYYNTNADGYKTTNKCNISLFPMHFKILFLENESNSNSEFTCIGSEENLYGSKLISDYKLTMYTSYFI